MHVVLGGYEKKINTIFAKSARFSASRVFARSRADKICMTMMKRFVLYSPVVLNELECARKTDVERMIYATRPVKTA